MTDITARLTEAADHLDWLYEGAKHVPTDLFHPEDERGVLLSRSVKRPVARFFWGGAAEVFMTLGPATLPALAQWLRTEALATARDENHGACTTATCTSLAALKLADHILTTKENLT